MGPMKATAEATPVVAGNLPAGGHPVDVGLSVDVARFRREFRTLAGG